MRSVIYTQDFEPITVIELPVFLQTELENRRRVSIPVYRPIEIWCDPELVPECIQASWYVRIEADALMRRGKKTMILFTSDEETALLLKSAFLPGQYRQLQEAERTAFVRGFMFAVGGIAR